MRIAHLSDPHINLKYHPQHLPRLRRILENALANGADHIVISGDITSNADIRDLKTARRLFESLGILKPSKLTIVLGNHDIFGGPQTAEDVLSFPDRCRRTNTGERLAIFQENFAELFSDCIRLDGAAYPFLKRQKDIAIIGLNTNAEYSLIGNPVGSNGEITKVSRKLTEQLANFHAWQTAKRRIVVMHHHLFRRVELETIAGAAANDLGAVIEHRTLKLHGKSKISAMLKSMKTDLVLHGHVHFTAAYDRDGFMCLNGAGAIYPVRREDGYKYHMIDLSPRGISVAIKQVRKREQQNIDIKDTTIPSFTDNSGVMLAG